MRRLLLACFGVLSLAGLACGGEVASPQGPRSTTKEGWEEWMGAPAWVVAPPPREGFAPFVIAAQSNLLELTLPQSGKISDPWVRRAAARRLRPVLGADADAAVSKAAAPTLARKGYYLELPKRGANYPGAQTYTGYQLWELPLDGLLAAVPEAKREAASRAVRAPEPEGSPAWEVGAPPAWAARPSAVEGFVTVVLRQPCDRADVARVNAMLIGSEWLGESVTSALSDLLTRKVAFGVGEVAQGWALLRARAVETGGAEPVAWTLWDVPSAPLLGAVEEAKRAAAAKALERPLLFPK